MCVCVAIMVIVAELSLCVGSVNLWCERLSSAHAVLKSHAHSYSIPNQNILYHMCSCVCICTTYFCCCLVYWEWKNALLLDAAAIASVHAYEYNVVEPFWSQIVIATVSMNFCGQLTLLRKPGPYNGCCQVGTLKGCRQSGFALKKLPWSQVAQRLPRNWNELITVDWHTLLIFYSTWRQPVHPRCQFPILIVLLAARLFKTTIGTHRGNEKENCS